ncbi:metal-dependent hydrolase [Candidatus Woesearchaeota archaeon]|nr:metal-dependent hydrolase [Candidatus Woesearchaeota archaeon]
MDSLFHFIFSITGGAASGIHTKHNVLTLLSLGFLATIIDIDHFFGTPRGTLHNLFLAAVIPLIFFLIFFMKKKRFYQNICLLIMIFLVGHVVADLFEQGGVMVFYPLSEKIYKIPGSWELGVGEYPAGLISTDGIAITLYFLIIMTAAFVDDFTYFLEVKHEKPRKAFARTIKKIKK